MSSLIRRSGLPTFEDFPFSNLRLFEDTLNRFFDQPASARPWSPSVDIAENENELTLTADLPGVKMDDLDIKIEEGVLTLSGARKFENEEKKGNYHRIERAYGSFHRAFSLPDTIDADKVQARFDNGVLRVTLPKKEVARPRSIKVTVG
ncbi:MAG: Hsp20/alpha crystallin family protein [Bryobacteraceae bacterium]|nr:Hsp20/alpha crystallin family protein [Bryobacteraceae bacterium]